jgi:hypothetical protein
MYEAPERCRLCGEEYRPRERNERIPFESGTAHPDCVRERERDEDAGSRCTASCGWCGRCS